MHLLPLTFQFQLSSRKTICPPPFMSRSKRPCEFVKRSQLFIGAPANSRCEGRESSQRRAKSKAEQRDDRTTDYGASTGKEQRARKTPNAKAERPTQTGRFKVRFGKAAETNRLAACAPQKGRRPDDRTTDYGTSILISCLARTSKSSSRLSQRFSALPPFLRSAGANPVRFSL
jgi:hypothetical protein